MTNTCGLIPFVSVPRSALVLRSCTYRAYSRNLGHVFEWKIKEHFSLRKRHSRSLIPLKSQRFWYLKAF